MCRLPDLENDIETHAKVKMLRFQQNCLGYIENFKFLDVVHISGDRSFIIFELI